MELFAVDGTEEPGSTSSKVLAINSSFLDLFSENFREDNIAIDDIFFIFSMRDTLKFLNQINSYWQFFQTINLWSDRVH